MSDKTAHGVGHQSNFTDVMANIKQQQILENNLLQHLKDFLLAGPYRLALIGQNYQINLVDNAYFIDLVFYHRKLKCLFAIQLKAGEFKVEYAEKLELSIHLLNDYLREEGENSSIGLLMCAGDDGVKIHYALSGLDSHTNHFSLIESLPLDLHDILPDVPALTRSIEARLKCRLELENTTV